MEQEHPKQQKSTSEGGNHKSARPRDCLSFVWQIIELAQGGLFVELLLGAPM